MVRRCGAVSDSSRTRRLRKRNKRARRGRRDYTAPRRADPKDSLRHSVHRSLAPRPAGRVYDSEGGRIARTPRVLTTTTPSCGRRKRLVTRTRPCWRQADGASRTDRVRSYMNEGGRAPRGDSAASSTPARRGIPVVRPQGRIPATSFRRVRTAALPALVGSFFGGEHERRVHTKWVIRVPWPTRSSRSAAFDR